MKTIIKHITKITITLSNNKKERIEKNFTKEYSKSIEDYLKDGLKKYENIEVVVLNRPNERKQRLPPTHATSKLGICVEQKNDFVFERIDKTEKQGIINPTLRVAKGTLYASLKDDTLAEGVL